LQLKINNDKISHCARIYVCLFSACCSVQVVVLRLVTSGCSIYNKVKTWKREVLGGIGVLTSWTEGYVMVDGQTVAEITVGMDRMGTSLNGLNANIYGRLNLEACALYCRFNERVTLTRPSIN
jgi:hypothetical protein